MYGEGRIARGWRLTKTGWQVLLHDRTALTLAAVQAIASAAVAIVIFWLSGWASHPRQESRLVLAALIAYWPSMFVNTFVGVALCAAAAAAMDGRPLTLSQALAVPMRRFGQILVWSLLATGVGLLIEQLATRIPFGGRLIGWLAGVAWSLGTLFVLPILALDGCMATECVRRSARLVKTQWGEEVTGNLAIGAWTIVAVLPIALVVGVVSGITRNHAAPWVAYAGAIVLVGSLAWSATRVFSVALYRYASEGDRSTGAFAPSDLERPFRPKRCGLFGKR